MTTTYNFNNNKKKMKKKDTFFTIESMNASLIVGDAAL